MPWTKFYYANNEDRFTLDKYLIVYELKDTLTRKKSKHFIK